MSDREELYDDDALFEQVAAEIENREPVDPEEPAADEAQAQADDAEVAESAGEQADDEGDADEAHEEDAEDEGSNEPAAPTIPDEIRQELEYLRARAQSDAGRVAAYQRKYEELKAALEHAQSATKGSDSDQPSTKDAMDAMKAGRWSEFAQEFPEFAEAVQEFVSQNVSTAIEQNIKPLQEKLTPLEQAQQQYTIERELAALAARHPDYQQVAASTQFQSWVMQQPEPIRQLVNSTSASDADWLLTRFKQDAGYTVQGAQAERSQNTEALRQKREKKLKQAVLPATKGAGTPLDADSEDALFDSVARQVEREMKLR